MTTLYTSTVTARGHLVAGAVLGAAIGGWVALAVWWPLGVLAGLAVLLTGVHLGIVRLAVRADEVRVALGPWPWSRRIPVGAIAAADATHLTRAQVFGIGLPLHARSSRLTVRSGPTLRLALRDGEELLISTADARVPVALLSSPID